MIRNLRSRVEILPDSYLKIVSIRRQASLCNRDAHGLFLSSAKQLESNDVSDTNELALVVVKSAAVTLVDGGIHTHNAEGDLGSSVCGGHSNMLGIHADNSHGGIRVTRGQRKCRAKEQAYYAYDRTYLYFHFAPPFYSWSLRYGLFSALEERREQKSRRKHDN